MRRASWWIRLPLVALAGATIAAGAGVRVNWTPSLPVGFYQVMPVEGLPARGVLVRACLPSEVARFARERGYLGAGPCPGDAMPVLKPVAALPGDVVVVASDGVRVNGALVAPAGRAEDSQGRPMAPMPAGAYPVSPGAAWLLSAHSAVGFDSRYFGAIPAASIDAAVRPLLTYGEEDVMSMLDRVTGWLQGRSDAPARLEQEVAVAEVAQPARDIAGVPTLTAMTVGGSEAERLAYADVARALARNDEREPFAMTPEEAETQAMIDRAADAALDEQLAWNDGIDPLSTADWFTYAPGQELRTHIGQSDEGYHYAVEVSTGGGDNYENGLPWSQAYNTREEASAAARERRSDIMRSDDENEL